LDHVVAAVRRGEIDAMVVWRLDRWGQSVVDLLHTLQEFQALGVGFVSVTEALGLTLPSGRAIEGYCDEARDQQSGGSAYPRVAQTVSDRLSEPVMSERKYTTEFALNAVVAHMAVVQQDELDEPDIAKLFDDAQPRSAQQVRTVIEEAWIDAGRALFDTATLPPSAVTSDLFAEKVLIERSAFMEAQQAALATKRDALTEEGWGEVVVPTSSASFAEACSFTPPSRRRSRSWWRVSPNSLPMPQAASSRTRNWPRR
jgi:hypothetical protein